MRNDKWYPANAVYYALPPRHNDLGFGDTLSKARGLGSQTTIDMAACYMWGSVEFGAPNEGDKGGTTTPDDIEECGPNWTAEIGGLRDHEGGLGTATCEKGVPRRCDLIVKAITCGVDNSETVL
ncbi:hypothetical protein GOBAR_DD07606 [Gossypium barbadense]|nr:hypothetical protein GOBAR_DD07606 [Gossypium barbadense]